MMLTNRFLNLLQGRLALMKRDVWALELAKRWKRRGKGHQRGRAGIYLGIHPADGKLPTAASDQAKLRDNGEGRRIQHALTLAS